MAIINEISESSTLPRRTGEYVPGTISIDLTTSKFDLPSSNPTFERQNLRTKTVEQLISLGKTIPRESAQLSVTWSQEQANPSLDYTQMEEIPLTQTVQDLLAFKFKLEPNQMQSIRLSVGGSHVFLLPNAGTYWQDINNFRPQWEGYCSAKLFLTKQLKTSDPILEFFRTVPSGDRLKRCHVGSPLVGHLTEFVKDDGRSWLTDSSMELGISLIQAYRAASHLPVLSYSCYFWEALLRPDELPSRAFLDDVRQTYLDYHTTIEKIMFPVCHSSHWYAVCISFSQQRILYAEGYNKRAPPPELASALNKFLQTLNILTTPWRCVRWTAPQQDQGDSNNCGPIALSVMERWCSGSKRDQWSRRSPLNNRLRYIRLAIALHNGVDYEEDEEEEQEGEEEEEEEEDEGDEGEQAVGMDIRDNMAKALQGNITSGVPGDISENRQDVLKHELDGDLQDPLSYSASYSIAADLVTKAQQLKGLIVDQVPRPSKIVHRADPLPYSMDPIGPSDRKCDFCGPPFNDFTEEEMKARWICDFSCGKRYVAEHLAKPYGHTVIHGIVRHNSDNGYKKISLQCSQARKPYEKKKKGIVPAGRRNRLSKRIECQWRLNINAAPTRGNIPYFTHVVLLHSHPSWPPDEGKARLLDTLTSEEKDQVHELSDLHRGQIVSLMEKKNPGKAFDSKSKLRQISNLITQTRQHEKASIEAEGGEMAKLVRQLTELKEKDTDWVYYIDHDAQNRLTRLFWQTPAQVALFRLYGGVISMDVAMDRNAYRMPLTTFVVADGDYKSRNVAHSLHDKQDTDAFVWILTCLNKALAPGTHLVYDGIQVIISDGDNAMAAAISIVLPHAFHVRCLHHILLNLKKNLGKILGQNYPKFATEFFWVYQRASVETFEQAWTGMLGHWPEVRHYVSSLYAVREKWAFAWVGTHFTAGQRTTGRVESEHKNQKQLGLNLGARLNQVFTTLVKRAEKQTTDAFETSHYNVQRSHAKYDWDESVDAYASGITFECRKFLTLFAFEQIRNELLESLKIADVSVVNIRTRIQGDGREWEQIEPTYLPFNNAAEEERLLEYRSTIGFSALIDLIAVKIGSPDLAVIYRVASREVRDQNLQYRPGRIHYVAFLPDHTSICSCLRILNLGLHCRHQFAVMLRHHHHLFHVKHIHSHWIWPVERQQAASQPWISLGRKGSTTEATKSCSLNVSVSNSDKLNLSTRRTEISMPAATMSTPRSDIPIPGVTPSPRNSQLPIPTVTMSTRMSEIPISRVTPSPPSSQIPISSYDITTLRTPLPRQKLSDKKKLRADYDAATKRVYSKVEYSPTKRRRLYSTIDAIEQEIDEEHNMMYGAVGVPQSVTAVSEPLVISQAGRKRTTRLKSCVEDGNKRKSRKSKKVSST